MTSLRVLGLGSTVALFAATARAQPTAATARGPADAPGIEIVVEDVRPSPEGTRTEVSSYEARKVAGTQGDPVKIVEDMPGIARPAFGGGQLVVWGAAPGDTRVFVDGVEIPSLYHGSALRGTINGDLLESVTFSPGAYGPELGRSIGGTVELATRDLSLEGTHAMVDANTLDGSLRVERAVGERVRIAVAGRYGWIDRLVDAVGAPDFGDVFSIPRYHDYQAKAELDLRPRESLAAVVLGSSDASTHAVPSRDPAHARSLVTSSAFDRVYLRYRRVFPDGSRVEVVPWIGRDSASTNAHFGATPALLDDASLRWGLRASQRTLIGSHVTLDLGMDAAATHAALERRGSVTIPPREGDIVAFGQPPGDGVATDSWSTRVVDIAPYAKATVALGALTVVPGARFDGILIEASRRTPRIGETPPIGSTDFVVVVEPRAAMSYRVSPRVELLGSMGAYSEPPASSDLSAVFGSPTLGPARAVHGSMGEAVGLTRDLSMSVLGFYEHMTHLAVRDPSPSPRLAQALLERGEGRSFGVQTWLRLRPWRGFSGWIGSTVSRSERRDGSGGRYCSFDYDRPYALTAVLGKDLGRWTFGSRFRYASGLPRTPVIGAFYDDRDDVFQPVFGAQNSVRLPAFWQLDLRVERRFRLGPTARLLVSVDALNVTDRANAEEFAYSFDYAHRDVVRGLPFLAVFGARLEM